ncbi:MAG TPA: universal stress protein [Casimicrobiaceae bacterium]|nr:universal stress protein [Casimicrobiaceae bacterium]
MFRRILVPIDGSPPAKRGLDEALMLARDQAARLCLLHVVDESIVTQTFEATTYMSASYIDDFLRSLTTAGKRLLARAEARARQKRVKADTALRETAGRRVADVIVAEAKKWRADVIVLGTHGRSGLSRVVLGSDAELVVRESPVPVLLVRGRVTRTRGRAGSRRR